MPHPLSCSESRSNALIPQGNRLAAREVRAIVAHSNQASLLYPATNLLVDQTLRHPPLYRMICHFPVNAQ